MQIIKGAITLLAVAVAAIALQNIDLQPAQIKTVLSNSRFAEQRSLIAGPVDLNTATAEELEAVPRIGPSLAKKIIEFRAEKGRINDINELLDIKGVGVRLLKTISPYLRAEK